MSPLIIVGVQPFAQEKLSLWMITLFVFIGLFTGTTFVWWMGGWPFGSDESRKE